MKEITCVVCKELIKIPDEYETDICYKCSIEHIKQLRFDNSCMHNSFYTQFTRCGCGRLRDIIAECINPDCVEKD